MIIEMAFAPFAFATALTAFGLPMLLASMLYETVLPNGILRSSDHTVF